MGFKEYATKKILTKIGEKAAWGATVKTIQHIEKKNDANALRNRADLASATYTTVTTTTTTTVETDELDDNVYEGVVSQNNSLANTNTNTNSKSINVTDLDSYLASLNSSKQNQNNSNQKSTNKIVTEVVSTESFFDKPSVHLLTIDQQVLAIRNTYIIKDAYGTVKYKAKSQGFPTSPMIGVYDDNNMELATVSSTTKNTPVYKLKYRNKCIASLHQKLSLKPKFDIPENGWYVEGGLTQTVIYDQQGGIAGKIQYTFSSSGHATVEYINPQNEIPIMLIALAMIMAYHFN